MLLFYIYDTLRKGSPFRDRKGIVKISMKEHSRFTDIIKDRLNSIKVALAILLAAGVVLCVGSLQKKLEDKKNTLSDVNSAINEVAGKISGEYSTSEDMVEAIEQIYDIISEKQNELEELVKTNEQNREILNSQNETITSQNNTIIEYSETIDSQAQAIEQRDEAIDEITRIVGKDIDPIDGDALKSAIQDIEETEKVIVQTYKTPVQMTAYYQQLEETKSELTEMLSFYPDGNPAVGEISYTFGNHYVKKNGKTVTSFHRGLDIYNKNGGAIYATADGTVTEVHLRDDGTGLGYYVRIDHGNGYMTLYGHVKSATVQVGDKVEKGQQIAWMGKTGAATGIHVHYEVYLYGKLQDPINYVDY